MSLNEVDEAKRIYIGTVVKYLKEMFEGIFTYFLQTYKFLLNEI